MSTTPLPVLIIVRKLKQKLPITDIDISDACLYSLVEPEVMTMVTETLTILTNDNPYYVQMFLKKIINLIELKLRDYDYDAEDYYNLYVTVLSSNANPPEKPECVTYGLSSQEMKIFETPRLLNVSGSTGNRTWEACLFITEQLIENFEEIIDDKEKVNILELGAGTGVLSLGLCQIFLNNHIDNIYITDGDPLVFEQTKKNFINNRITNFEKIKFQQLLWGGKEDDLPKIDLIIAADVTYDTVILEPLIITISHNITKFAFIAATIRNENTIKEFESVVKKYGLRFEIWKKETNPGYRNDDRLYSVYFKKSEPEIRIYKLFK